MGYLIFATGRRVTIPTAITGNAGTGNYSFRVRSGPNGITLPASGVAGFIGTSSTSTSNGLVTNSTGQLRVYTAGTNRYGSTSALITSGVQFDYTLSHNAGTGAWDIFNNLTGTPTGESGTFATSTSFAALNQLGRSSNSSAVYLVGDMEIIAVTGLTNAQEYDANLSGGTGLTLPTTSGSNQGTLVGFGATDADNWGGFSVPSVTASASFTMPQFSVAASASVTVPVYSAAVSVTMPQMAAAIAAAVASPEYSAAVSVTMPQMTVAASASNSAPVYSSSVSFAMPQMQVAASASASVAGNSAVIALSMPQMVAAIDAASSVPTYSASVSVTMPQMSVSAAAASVSPDSNTATVGFAMPQFTVAASGSVSAPSISAAINFAMPQMVVQVSTFEAEYFAADNIELVTLSRHIELASLSAHIELASQSTALELLASSRHLEYTTPSTHLEWRA
jgi:hypothetical protein